MMRLTAASLTRPGRVAPTRLVHQCCLATMLALLGCREEVKHDGKPIAYWVQQMTNPDSAVRHQAVAAFAHDAGRLPEAARALLEVLSDERESDVHATIADALGTLGPYALEAAPALVRLLDDEHPVVRQSAASALGGLGTRSPLVVPALIHALDDEDHDVRGAAADGLARAGPAAASAGASLKKLVSTDRIGWVRLRATIALGRVRAAPEATLPVLVGIIKRDDWPALRTAAVDALSSYATADPAAAQAIAAAARDTSPEVREAAARARRAVASRDSSLAR